MKSIPADAEVEAYVEGVLGGMDRAAMEASLKQALVAELGMSEEEISDYLAKMSDEELSDIFAQSIEAQYVAMYAAKVAQQLSSLPPANLLGMLSAEIEALGE